MAYQRVKIGSQISNFAKHSFGTTVDITSYLYPNSYTVPFDGIVVLTAHVAGTIRIIINNVTIENQVNAPANTTINFVVRKGMTVSWNGSTGDSFSFVPYI